MARRTVGTLLVLAVTACAATVWGQDAAQAPGAIHQHTVDESGASLTLSQALDEALLHNPTLATVRAQFAVEQQRRAGQGFLAPPTLEAEIWQWPLTSVNPLDTNMYMFTMRQEIPGRGKRQALAAAADRAVDVAANDIAIRAREVIAQVTRAFADLAINRQSIVIHQAHVDLLRQIAELTTARYGAGRGAQQEALKAIAEISRLHGDLIALNERASLAAADLNALLDRDPQSPIGTITLTRATAPLPPIAVLQRLALERHPELKGAELETARAQAQVNVATANYQPDFMVMGGYQLMPRTAGAWTASVGINWPGAPWSRGTLDAKRAEATAGVDVARARQTEIANAIRLAVQHAAIRESSAAERARLIETTVIPQLQQVLESSRIAYAAEQGDASSVVDNQRMVLDARLEYFNAVSEADIARAELERAVGVDLGSLAAAGWAR